MKRNFKIKIEIDSSADVPEVIIKTKEETDLTREIVSYFEKYTEHDRVTIEAVRDNVTCQISQSDIMRLYLEDRKIIICSTGGEYHTRSALRDLESILDGDWFVRISRSEIINLNYVASFDISIKGTTKVIFEDGSYSWVSRRMVRPVQQRLAILAREGGKRND